MVGVVVIAVTAMIVVPVQEWLWGEDGGNNGGGVGMRMVLVVE